MSQQNRWQNVHVFCWFFAILPIAAIAGCELGLIREPGDEVVTFLVDGMTDGASVREIESKLEAIPGVTDAVVSFEMQSADVSYDPNVTGPGAMIDAIEDPWRLTIVR